MQIRRKPYSQSLAQRSKQKGDIVQRIPEKKSLNCAAGFNLMQKLYWTSVNGKEAYGGCIFVDCVSSLCVGLISDLILQFVSVELQLQLLHYHWSTAAFSSSCGITIQEVESTDWIQPCEVRSMHLSGIT